MNEHVRRLVVRQSAVREGQVFGRLRVVGIPFRARINQKWERNYVVCRCRCKNLCVCEVEPIETGKINSCGCAGGPSTFAV